MEGNKDIQIQYVSAFVQGMIRLNLMMMGHRVATSRTRKQLKCGTLEVKTGLCFARPTQTTRERLAGTDAVVKPGSNHGSSAVHHSDVYCRAARL